MLSRSAYRALFIKAVSRTERDVNQVVAAFFRREISDMASAFESMGALSFDPAQFAQRLTEALVPPIARAMYEGAFTQVRLAQNVRGDSFLKASTASEAVDQYGLDVPASMTELPKWLVQTIEEELTVTFRQPYWLAIGSRDEVQAIVADGIKRGLSTRRITIEILKLRGLYSESRARTIARTESGRARNAGSEIGIRYLQDETGLQIGKIWLSVQGNTTRESHAAMNGVKTADATGTFNLNGVEVPYPQHRALPVSDTANCQCTVVSSLVADAF